MRSLNDPQHPMWPIIRLVVVGLILGLCMAFAYSNGFDFRKDSAVLITVLGALGGVDTIKHFVLKGTYKDEGKTENQTQQD